MATNPDRVVEAELEVGSLTIGDVGLQVGGSDVSSSNPVPTRESANTAGTPTHTADQTVDGTAGGVTILAANANRKTAFVQNVGAANIRVSVGGTPTATNGIQLVPGQRLTIDSPFCPTSAIKAIRESGVSSSAAVVEVV